MKMSGISMDWGHPKDQRAIDSSPRQWKAGAAGGGASSKPKATERREKTRQQRADGEAVGANHDEGNG